MQLLALLALAGISSASIPLQARESVAFMALKSIVERQVDICVPVPAPVTCERSCGPGFVQCIAPPTCYNPGRGDSCCSNGKYCPKGSYCTNAGCCDDGLSLEECGATVSLSVVPPPSTKTSTHSSAAPTTTPTAPATTTKSEPITTPSLPPTSVGTVTGTTTCSNGTVTATSPPIVTAGAGKNAVAALGAVGAFILAL